MLFRWSCLLWIALFCFPAEAVPYYVIHLENGGRFTTSRYWKEGSEIRFNVQGGVMGIQRSTVTQVQRGAEPRGPAAGSVADGQGLQAVPKPSPEKEVAEAAGPDRKPAAAIGKGLTKGQLDAMREEKRLLTDQLNEAQERLRQGSRNHDDAEKEKARQEMRQISKEIYDITDDVRNRNNGVLPKDWWSK